jgi:CheY-like chemotaxis protein
MESTGTSPHGHVRPDPRVRLLVADDDRLERSLLAACACDILSELVVLEAEDGAEAIQLGLQQRPEVALLDVNMPRLGGIEAANTLRELDPRMRIALQTGDVRTHRELARENGLTLFGKLDLDATLAWLHAQLRCFVDPPTEKLEPSKRDFVCSACGYGALRTTPPDCCPMCHAEHAWIDATRRAATVSLTR